MSSCPECGAVNRNEARFCDACGVSLSTAPSRSGSARAHGRRLVTVLFSDLSGSTEIGQRLDPEAFRSLLDRYFERMSAILRGHGGTLEKYIGDAIVAVFGLPVLREDDAVRAVRAALEMQRATDALASEFQAGYGVTVSTRIGILSGEVATSLEQGDQRMVAGDSVNLAARVQAAAGPGEVLIANSTAKLLRDTFELRPREPLAAKGVTHPLPVWLVAGPRDGGVATVSAFVGRAAEVASLCASAAAARDGVPQSVLVVGEAGLGKTRLLSEARSAWGPGLRTLSGRCRPTGDGDSDRAVVEIVLQAASIADASDAETVRACLEEALEDDPDAQRLAGRLSNLLGHGDVVGSLAELSLAVRSLLERVARREPVAVIVEDLHWAQAGMLEMVIDLLERADGALLVVATTRPTLFDDQPELEERLVRSQRLRLWPLAEDDVTAVLASLLEAPMPAALARRLNATAEGNPLFLEQLVGDLIDAGRLTRPGDRWLLSEEAEELEIPSTIRSLLAARLERLEAPVRGLLEGASVAGVVFALGAATELAPAGARTRSAEALTTLEDRRLVRPWPELVFGDIAFRFEHALVREVTYAGLTKAARAELHARLAEWLGQVAEQHAGDSDGLIGHHLAESLRYRRELRPGENHTQLAERAAEHLGRAGRASFDRGDMTAAVDSLRRAARLLPPAHPARLALVPVLGKALVEATRNRELAAYLDEAEAEAREAGDDIALAYASVWRGYLLTWTGLDADPEAARRLAEKARATLTQAGDIRGLTHVELLLAEVDWFVVRHAQAIDHWARAAELAQESGDPWDISETMALTVGQPWGLGSHVDVAIEHIRALMAASRGDPAVRCRGHQFLTLLLLDRDGPEAARPVLAVADGIAERMGLPIWRWETDWAGAVLELMAGDGHAALARVRPWLDGVGTYWEGVASATGAHALAMLGEVADARRLLERADSCLENNTLDRLNCGVDCVLALGLMHDPGASRRARALIAEADLAGEPHSQNELRLALAEVLLAEGDTAEAARWAADAEARFAARGLDFMAARAARLRRGEDPLRARS